MRLRIALNQIVHELDKDVVRAEAIGQQAGSLTGIGEAARVDEIDNLPTSVRRTARSDLPFGPPEMPWVERNIVVWTGTMRLREQQAEISVSTAALGHQDQTHKS